MERIEVCKTCLNQKFDRSQGIVCGLTGVKPVFDKSCDDYIKDPKFIPRVSIKYIRPNEERAKLAVIFILIAVFVELISMISDYFETNIYLALERGEEISMVAAEASDLRQLIIAGFLILSTIVSAVTFIQWFRRAYYNLMVRVPRMGIQDGWAAGAWFVPVYNLYKPFSIMKELWVETSLLISKRKDYTAQDHSVVGWWWALWLISAVISQVAFRLTMHAETISNMILANYFYMVSAIVTIPLAFLTIRMIKTYSAIENELIGVENEQEAEDSQLRM